MATLVILAACGTEPSPSWLDESTAEGSSPPVIEPLRSDEALVHEATGWDTLTTEPVELVSAGKYYVYGMCVSSGEVSSDAVVRITDVESRTVDLEVTCDGIVSRSQVYTEPGVAIELELTAHGDAAWAMLVTEPDAP